METEFPLSAQAVENMREDIAGHIMIIHDIESAAVDALKEAMA